jgi:hypothetical protein
MRLGRLRLLERRIIGNPEDPLLIRYILFRSVRFGVYVHQLCRSDHERALHDHPWSFISIVLRRGYIEVHDQTTTGQPIHVYHRPGRILLRPAEWRHRVCIDGRPAWTLILVGPHVREWGFFTPTGWCWWRRYNDRLGICEDSPIHNNRP